MPDLSQKIHAIRKHLGDTQAEFAHRLDVSQGTVSRWESGSMPESEPLAKLAELAGQSVLEFLGAHGDVEVAHSGPQLMIKGEVAAGVWRDVFELPADEWEPYTGGGHHPIDPKRRFGLRVVGDSMNMIYPHGTILDCISIFDVDPPVSGNRVIVVRRDLHDGIEATVKELVVEEDGTCWLVPRSTNPAFQVPIKLEPDGNNPEAPQIIAKVVGRYQPE